MLESASCYCCLLLQRLLDLKTFTYIQVIYFYQKCRSKAKNEKKAHNEQINKQTTDKKRQKKSIRNKITNENAFSARYSANDALYYATASAFAHQRVDIKPKTAIEMQRKETHTHKTAHNAAAKQMPSPNATIALRSKQFRKSYKMVTINYGRIRIWCTVIHLIWSPIRRYCNCKFVNVRLYLVVLSNESQECTVWCIWVFRSGCSTVFCFFSFFFLSLLRIGIRREKQWKLPVWRITFK